MLVMPWGRRMRVNLSHFLKTSFPIKFSLTAVASDKSRTLKTLLVDIVFRRDMSAVLIEPVTVRLVTVVFSSSEMLSDNVPASVNATVFDTMLVSVSVSPSAHTDTLVSSMNIDIKNIFIKPE